MPYLTPDAPPDETICYRLEIPADYNWIALVRGALSELVKAYNFEQFGSYTPEQTALRFLDMYDEFVFQGCSNMGCCYDLVLNRLTEEGALEISTDGGETWVQNPNDPRVTGVALPPPVMDATHTKCDAATNGGQHFSDFIAAYSESLGAAASVAALALEIAALIAAMLFAPESIPLLLPLLIAAVAAAFDLGQVAWDAYFTSDVHDDILCALACNIGDDGQFTPAQFEGFLADLNSWLPEGVAKGVFISHVRAIGVIGVNNLCSYGSSAEADCSSCACDGCDADNWVPWDDWYDPERFERGHDDELDVDYINAWSTPVTGSYALAITTNNPNRCCGIHIQTISGGAGNLRWDLCGEPLTVPPDDFNHFGIYAEGTSVHTFALISTEPFHVILRFYS